MPDNLLAIIISSLIGGGTIGVIIKGLLERRKTSASAHKTEAEAGGIVITGQSSILQTATDVANKFGDNVKQLLDHAQTMQSRYEELLSRYTEQLKETAKLKAEVDHLTQENIKLLAEVKQLRSENNSLRKDMTSIRARLDVLEDKSN